MNTIFKLNHVSGPHGDECSTYDIEFLKDNVTLYEFLCDLNKAEWGTIRLKVLNPSLAKLDYAMESEKYDEVRINYKNGKYKEERDRETCAPYLSNELDLSYRSWANGGWSLMDYWIKLK